MSNYVKLTSAEGHDFFVHRDCANVSQTIGAMLSGKPRLCTFFFPSFPSSPTPKTTTKHGLPRVVERLRPPCISWAAGISMVIVQEHPTPLSPPTHSHAFWHQYWPTATLTKMSFLFSSLLQHFQVPLPNQKKVRPPFQKSAPRCWKKSFNIFITNKGGPIQENPYLNFQSIQKKRWIYSWRPTF